MGRELCQVVYIYIYIYICTYVSVVNSTSLFRIKQHNREFLNYFTSYQSTLRNIPEDLKLITLNC